MNYLQASWKSYKDNNVPGVQRRELSGFLAELLSFQRRSTFYTCCFAMSGDDLPLWREYGGGGKGLNIGFRPTAVTSMPGRMQLVKYAEDDARDFFHSLMIQAAIAMGRPGSVQRVLALSETFAAITSLKHRSWRHEREARINFNQRHEKPDPAEVLTQFTGEYPDGSLIPWREPLIRKSRGREIRYIDFAFGRYNRGAWDPRRAIETVCRGPNCEMSSAEVNALLVAEGFEGYEVVESDCAIR